MAEQEMDTSLATGDSEPLKGDHHADKQVDKKDDLEIEQLPQPGSCTAKVRQTEPLDVPPDNHNKYGVTDDHEKVDLELQRESFDHCCTGDTDNIHAEAFEDSPLSKSVDFMFETKYVMLNFMSLIPPDMYRGHISTSPDIEPETYQRFGKSHSHLSKSKSFDISTHNRKPGIKHLGKLKSLQRHMNSPASEDNLSYHYKKNWKRLESPGCERFNSDPGSPLTASELFEKSHNVHEFSNHSSPALSPRKGLYSPQRQFSDASSSGELSYMSDADDELEEYSNASSIFSARSISSRDGFLDLRRSVHILPTLPSQSEEIDEADGFVPRPYDDTKTAAESSNLEMLPEEVNDGSKVETERDGQSLESLQQEVSDNVSKSRIKQTADRSKLKLNIPCEPVQLDDILLSLHTELSSEMDDLESEFEEALQSARSRMSRSGFRTPLTPQSEAARVLARIGDEVKEQYGARLAAAVNGLTYEQINSLSYTQFRDIAQSVVTAEVPGWRQVALLMVFGQKIIWGAVQQGHTHFGNVINYCSQFVAENAAEFIIKQGGWGSVMNFDPSSDTQSSGDFDTSPEMVVEYFTSHDVTQVDSGKCLDDTPEEATKNEQGVSVMEDKGQAQNGERSNTAGQGLTVQTVKTRYASSVGFEYTDDIEDLPEIETRSDSEQDISLTFAQIVDVEKSVDNIENVTTESWKVRGRHEKTSDQEGDDKEHILEETIDGVTNNDNDVSKVPNDLTKNNVPDITNTNGYDRDSVYIRQPTPSVFTFDSTADSLEKSKDADGKSAIEEQVNDIDSGEENSNSKRITAVKSGVVGDAVVNCESVTERNVSDDDITNDEAVGTGARGTLHLNNNNNNSNTSFDKESVNESSTQEVSVDNEVVSDQEILNKNDGSGETSSSNTHAFPGNGEHSLNADDLRNIGESNINNNQNKVEVESYSSSNHGDNFEYKSDEECIEREVTEESHVPASFTGIGFRVVALALAVLVLGISVRLAIVNK